MRAQERRHLRPGFTLVELLVVISIILLASLVAIPTLMTNLGGRQVTDAARIFSGALVGARDSAIRYNEPRGIRLLPDPTLTINDPTSGVNVQLCYNRMIPIEPAGDYSEGRVSIGPYHSGGGNPTGFPPLYPLPSGTTAKYPFPDSSPAQQAVTNRVLMIEEAPYAGGFVLSNGYPNSPTNWYWNVRIGDKIKVNGTGRAYTIVGPCTINPWATTASGNRGNPELFVNVGQPGTAGPLLRTYYSPSTATPPNGPYTTARPEFLFVVNGEDDDKDGYVDEGWDGFDNDYDGITDAFAEWETETWLGSLVSDALLDSPLATATATPTQAWAVANIAKGTQDVPYIIQRRPVPSQGAREVMLPAGMVIDATTWNSTRERSRLPVDPNSLYCDIMVNPNGLYIPSTLYSTPTSANPLPFLHFWITDRNDVHPRGALWGLTAGVPNKNPSDPSGSTGYVYYELPMTTDALGVTGGVVSIPSSDGQYYPGTNSTFPVLKNDRRLVTMFAQSGLVTTNTIEPVPPSTGIIAPGEGFNVGDVNYPFLKAQQGSREAR